MRHVNNDPNKILLQNAMMAQQVAEAAKNRQAERSRAQAAEDVEKLHSDDENHEIKKVPGKSREGKEGQKESARNTQKWLYRPDGTLEIEGGLPEGPDSPAVKRIDLKA